MKSLNILITLVVSIALVLGCLDTLQAQTNAFAVDPAELSFSTPTGASPLPKILNVGTTGAAVAFVLQVTGGLTCSQIVNYQIASPTSTTPTQVTIAAQTPSLPAGTYDCGVTLTASGLASKSVPIRITVGGGTGTSGSLSVSTTSISLSAAAGGQSATTTLRITNSNALSAVNFTAVPTSAGWLQISTSTTVPAAGSVDMQIQANPAGLATGSYDGSIAITPAGGTAITVAVSFSVTGNPTLQVKQGGSTVSAVNFAYQIGTALPTTQSLSLSSSSQTTQLTCTVAQLGSNFLVVLPTGSVTTPQTLQLQIASTAAQLPAGTYSASVSLSCPNASNPSVTIPVNLLVSSLPLLTAGTLPSTFTYQTGGPNPAVQTVSIATTSTAVAFTTSVTAGQGWLTVTPSAGTASATVPQVLTLAVNPAGLGAGNYTGSVTVASSGAGNSLIIPVALTVTTGTVLSATPMGFAFSYQTTGGAPAPGSRQITITSPVDVVFNISIAYSQCSSWLNVNVTTGTAVPFGTPVTLSVNPAGITPPSHCAATVSITASTAPNTINIPVTLDVSANPILTVSTGALTLNGQLGAGNSQPASFSVFSSDSITALQFSVTSPAAWLFISPSAGTTAANIQIQANTSAAGLQVGPNTTRLTVSSPSLPSPGYIDIPVTLNLTSNANLTVDKSSLTFTQTQGGAAPAAQTLSIAVAGGSGAYTYGASASASFGAWLSVTPTSGNVPAQLTVSANGANLSQGTYNGQIVITVPGAANSPQTVNVTLNVTSPQTLSVSPATLAFATAIGSPKPPDQTVQVTSTGGPVTFTVGTTYTNCPGFLSVTPTSASTPASITVGVNVANLQAITCTGAINFTANGVQTQTVNVTLTVGAALAPQITTVVNGASFIPGAVAPGEIVTLFGSNLGPTTLANYILNPDNTFATKVSDSEVLFDGVAAPIIFVRNDQVAVAVPFQVAGRFQTNIQVRRSGQLSNQLQQRVVDTAPGFFTIPSGGTGQGAIVNQNGTINSAAAPAPKGSVVSFYITGGGQTTPPGVSGTINGTDPLNRIIAPVQVTIGGQQATVQYSGGAPGNIQGLYQLNVVVPMTAASGNQPVQVTIGGQPSQGNVTMAIQ